MHGDEGRRTPEETALGDGSRFGKEETERTRLCTCTFGS